jgi:hypothetical protein
MTDVSVPPWRPALVRVMISSYIFKAPSNQDSFILVLGFICVTTASAFLANPNVAPTAFDKTQVPWLSFVSAVGGSAPT